MKVSRDEAFAPTHFVERFIQADRAYHPGDVVQADTWANREALERSGHLRRLPIDPVTEASRAKARAEFLIIDTKDEAERLRKDLTTLDKEKARLRTQLEELERLLTERDQVKAALVEVDRRIGAARFGIDAVPGRLAEFERQLGRAERALSAFTAGPAA